MPSPDPHFLAEGGSATELSQTQTFAARYAFSQALARHLALSAFERTIDAFAQRVQPLYTLICIERPQAQWFEPASELLRIRRDYQPDRQQGHSFGDSTIAPSQMFYSQNPVLQGDHLFILILFLHPLTS